MMEKPRPRAAKENNDSGLANQNRNEIANGISLRRKTPLALREGSPCMGMPMGIRSTSVIRLGYVRAASSQEFEEAPLPEAWLAP